MHTSPLVGVYFFKRGLKFVWYSNGDAAVAVTAVLGLVVNGFSEGQGVLLKEVP